MKCTACVILIKVKIGSKGNEISRKRKRRRICCCLCGDSSSKNEEPAKKKDNMKKERKCGMCCFSSNKPKSNRRNGKQSKEEEKKIVKKDENCSCGCTCCSSSTNTCCWKKKEKKKKDNVAIVGKVMHFKPDSIKDIPVAQGIIRIGNENIAARVFTYRELSESTQSFASECLLGEGGIGKVYKGKLKETNEIIAVKKLNKNGYQGNNREFLLEVLMLSLLSHPNLVNLLGYCADGDERILVYDYMPHGSLQDLLLDLSPYSKSLGWNTRMKIALGVAKGLEHLHDMASPPVIFRDLKASNILLDYDYNPRLIDFGLHKFGPSGTKNHVATRVMGTYGYCAPEYALTGKLTTMSDIYSFGVVLLELITGRKAMDSSRPTNEQRLVDWALPRFKNKKNFVQMVDPLLERNFSMKSLHQAVAIAAMCIQEEDTTRPLIKDMVRALQALVKEGKDSSIEVESYNNEAHTKKNHGSITDKDSIHSSNSDWQSCSTAKEDVEEIKEEIIVL